MVVLYRVRGAISVTVKAVLPDGDIEVDLPDGRMARITARYNKPLDVWIAVE